MLKLSRLGSFSRRNSHCSIIQTNDNVLLVQCRTDLENRKSIDVVNFDYTDIDKVADNNTTDRPGSCSSSGNSSFCSLDLDLNIRQLEETQARINDTLENLFKLRHSEQQRHSDNVVNNTLVLRDSEAREQQTTSCIFSSHTSQGGGVSGEMSTTRKHRSVMNCVEKESRNSHLYPGKKRETDVCERSQNILNGNSPLGIHVNKIISSSNQNNNNIRNSNHQQFFKQESPVKSKIQGLINSGVKILKNRNSIEKEVSDEENNLVLRDRKITRSKETFSVEDFTELIKSLPANHFTDEVSESGLKPAPDKKKVLFHIANELMTSEKDFVANLRIICEDFASFMIHSSNNSSVGPNNFGNLEDIYHLAKALLQQFQYRVQYWDQLKKISDVFLQYTSHFKVYLPYLGNFSSMSKHFDECCSNNSQYRKVCLNFEKLPVCRNLKIQHFLLKPVQRLPQYKLLLADYLKNLSKDDEDYADTVEALEFITNLLKNANDVIL